MASNLTEFQRRALIQGQGYNKGGLKGEGKIGDFFKNTLNRAKQFNNYLKDSKIISRTTGTILNNPISKSLLNLAPKSATDILEKTNQTALKYGYGKKPKKKGNGKKKMKK